ncbi:TPM domain-containing protein [Flavobacterium sp. 3HN19-14]|uniref:TPM domain-containing protein n=1 Tax=Flavobacterium sp. 3HN19-14 TaxID=3448133 RepID=UPI003EE3781A
MSENKFLTETEESEIVAAIRLAEKETSGEIRVHIEKTTSMDTFERAKEVFSLLKMDETALKNGVLIYLAVDDKAFVVCGDKGIDDIVGDDFWDTTKEVMAGHFKNGDFKQGLIEGIARAGKELQRYFPCEDDDQDELSNEISRGE